MSKIEDHPHLERDERSNAVFNKDTDAFTRARMAKERRKTEREEINTLKEEMNDVKNLLLQINEKMKWQEQ